MQYTDIDATFSERIGYYLLLESDFIQTFETIPLNIANLTTESYEYVKLLQVICSEIDDAAHQLCRMIIPDFNERSNISGYCKCLIDNNPLFHRAVTSTNRLPGIIISPWLGWRYKLEDKNGKSKIISTNPYWWTMHNKIKHSRTKINKQTGKKYEHDGNQRNVLSALAGLFIIDAYMINKMCESMDGPQKGAYLSRLYNSSQLFDSFLVAGPL